MRRIAVVVDWLTTYAGAERVVGQILACYPEADIFTLLDFLPDDQRGFLRGKKPHVSFMQKLPGVRKHYRLYLPIMPFAIEQFDLSSYELIISSSHAVAKGVIVGPGQLHISYVHSPIRYAWDLQHQYLKESGLEKRWFGWLARWHLHKIRLWDVRTQFGVDEFISCSRFIAKRIRRVYGRDSNVIYPPVDVSAFSLCAEKKEFYLTASRLVPYKKIDLIVKAFAQMPEKQLFVIGDGPDFAKIKSVSSSNVTLLGYQPFSVLRTYMQQAKAFVFAAEEDFGIAPVEAQACGTPVIAFGKGGALETVRGLDVVNSQPTGLFFDIQSVEAIVDAVNFFESNCYQFVPASIRQHAEQFSEECFLDNFRVFVDQAVIEFCKDR